MSRPLRIEYAGAWYHVMNRGTDRKLIFHRDQHRMLFLELLKECVQLYQIEIHAYCLMDNHYHLLVHTPHANLSRAMRHLNGVYTQRFNRLENRDGGLYRGRYKAILIEDENYLLQVSRYIHLNPVEAFICIDPENYPWSSYNAYLKTNDRFAWLTTNHIIAKLGNIEEYIDYVLSGVDDESKKFFNTIKKPAILGNKKFIETHIKNLSLPSCEEISPDIKRTRHLPSVKIILEEVSIFFKITDSNFLMKKRKNIPRLFVIYFAKHIALNTYEQIGNLLNSKKTAVGVALIRFQKDLKQSGSLKNDLAILQKRIYERFDEL